MSLEIIKQKINNGEGFIKMEIAGIIKVSEMDPSDNVVKVFNKYDYKLVDDELVLKTNEDYQEDEKKKIQLQLLNQFKPLIDAMTFQEISKQKGSKTENAIFSDNEIKEWGDYIGQIVKGKIDTVIPEIPEGYKNLL